MVELRRFRIEPFRIEPTAKPGQYRAKVKPDMAGDWTAALHYEGPRGTGSVSFSVNVKP